MAAPGIKFDDGTGGFATNCFPVRTLFPQSDEVSGAWLTAQKAEQRRRFKAYICSKPLTYDDIHNERKKVDRSNTAIIPQCPEADDDDDTKVLDGFFLMKQCCVDDPTDLCSVKINAQDLSEIKEEDLQLFDNVAYVNASENLLTLEPFRGFPVLRELELSLNGLRGFHITPTDFQHLEMLDLSYNNLSSDDVLPLGLIPHLKILHLTGNSLRTIPPDMARPHVNMETFEKLSRFKCLEILLLDDNKFSDQMIFAALAGLRKLKHLNLAKNQIKCVPQLLLVEGKHITYGPDTQRKHGRRSRPSSRRSTRSKNSGLITPIPENPSTDQSEPKKVDDETTIADSKTELTVEQHISTGKLEEKTSGDISMGDLGTLSEMKLEELNLDEMTKTLMESASPSKSNTAMAEQGTTVGDAFERDGDGDLPLPPPFPELTYLNLAHNKICDEESLLPVAAWPLLAELVIHDNPLTTQNSGDPPILRRFLKDRLGITIQRTVPDDPHKPHIEVPPRPNRKVVTKILPVPRVNVEEILALEAPRVPSIQPTPTTTPIHTARRDRASSIKHAAEDVLSLTGTPLPPITPRDSEEQEGEKTEKDDSSAFFMTQVEDGGRDATHQDAPCPQSPQSSHSSSIHTDISKNTDTSSLRRRLVNLNKYKGYEVLLDPDANETEGVPMPKDLPGNIRALQYALAHPLVFRDQPSDLQVPQPPYRPLIKASHPVGKPGKNRVEKMDDTLLHLRTRSTVLEMDLKTALIDRKTHKKDFPEAEQLLRGVQRRYNAVRATSMKKARDSHRGEEALKETIKDVRKQLEHISKPTPTTA